MTLELQPALRVVYGRTVKIKIKYGKNKKVKPRMLEERKLKAKRRNTSITLLQNQIMRLLARANQIYDELSEEHRTFFDKSIE